MFPFAEDFWLFLAFALLTGAVLAVLVRPLWSRTGRRLDEGESEIALYRDQLAEISRDLDRGVIGETEAEAARVEVSRRLLAADEARADLHARAHAADPRLRKVAALLMLLGLPGLALAIYLAQGAPGLPGQPAVERLNVPPETLPLEGLVVRIERQLKATPDDLQGWQLIAPAYIRLGRYDDAASAWTRAIILDGPTAERLAARGEARVLANDGTVGPGARADFERAEDLNPAEPRAQYFLGLAEFEAGDKAAALARWKALIAAAPADAAWVSEVEARIALAEGRPMPIAPEDEPAIRAMVEGLEARLDDQPEDIDGWLRLIRSWEVLGDPARAGAARTRALDIFREDPVALERIENAGLAPTL